eukprot:3457982-Prymnesium_polylepis.1
MPRLTCLGSWSGPINPFGAVVEYTRLGSHASVPPTPTRWSGRPYTALPLAPPDDAVCRFGSAGEGSLWGGRTSHPGGGESGRAGCSGAWDDQKRA